MHHGNIAADINLAVGNCEGTVVFMLSSSQNNITSNMDSKMT